MTDQDRNSRTLIVCFLCAIFALVPLRFVELGNQDYFNHQASVLGAQDQTEEVVLPDASINECFSEDEVESKVNSIVDIIKKNDLDERVKSVLQDQIDQIVNNQCQ